MGSAPLECTPVRKRIPGAWRYDVQVNDGYRRDAAHMLNRTSGKVKSKSSIFDDVSTIILSKDRFIGVPVRL